MGWAIIHYFEDVSSAVGVAVAKDSFTGDRSY